jgi:glycosyltransferase involved in cell wall biosynthesis
LPFSQVGYTLRTHYVAMAQAAAGLDPHVVTHMGYGTERFWPSRQIVDGVTYHRVAGPPRGSLPLDRWLARHTERVARLVTRLRPGILHAASDYLNPMTAAAIGRTFGIPVVYESRGFWEETWLSRQAKTFGWDLRQLEATHGLPDTYVWRRSIEDRCRREADRVVTLADAMAERIAAGGVDPGRITVIPNAVDADAFAVQTRSRRLATQLGIPDDTIVIGYISSIVEYEGIDTLIKAYAAISASTPTPVALLIVGDGPERSSLMRQAGELGVTGATFTGHVSHDAIFDYYGLIDIFVVPRKPVEVCHLVTPLKPFEAFATGRTVVLSNVRALAAIAHQSQAAELFEAGDPESLAGTLTALLNDEPRRKQLASAGADWVRTHRTWAANAAAYQRLYAELGAQAPSRAGTSER